MMFSLRSMRGATAGALGFCRPQVRVCARSGKCIQDEAAADFSSITSVNDSSAFKGHGK
jgi:hypothetical protein